MQILSGKHKGSVVELGQWANDWITGYPGAERPLVLKPPMVRLDAAEVARMRETEGWRKHGYFWRAWHLSDDGRLSPRPASEG